MGLLHNLLLICIKFLPAQSIYKHWMLLQILLQRILINENVCVLIVDEDLLVLKVVECVVVDCVGVIKSIGRRLLSKIMQKLVFTYLQLKKGIMFWSEIYLFTRYTKSNTKIILKVSYFFLRYWGEQFESERVINKIQKSLYPKWQHFLTHMWLRNKFFKIVKFVFLDAKVSL